MLLVVVPVPLTVPLVEALPAAFECVPREVLVAPLVPDALLPVVDFVLDADGVVADEVLLPVDCAYAGARALTTATASARLMKVAFMRFSSR